MSIFAKLFGRGEPRLLAGHTKRATCAAFSPDGNRLVTGSWDETARVWDVATGSALRVFRGNAGRVECVSFSPSGAEIGTADGSCFRLWNVNTGEPIASCADHIAAFAFSPDGRLIALGGGLDVVIWEISTGRELHRFAGHGHSITSIDFSPDGKCIVTGAQDQTVRFWDVAGLSQRNARGHGYDSEVSCVRFSPDGSVVASASWQDGQVKLWTPDGALIKDLKRGFGPVWSLAFTPTGHRLASGHGRDDKGGVIAIYDVDSGSQVGTLQHESRVPYGLAHSSHGNRLAAAYSDGNIGLWQSPASAA